MFGKHFLALLKARTMEFVRDRETFLWNLLFPVLLVFGFAFAFSGNGDTVFKVGVLGPVDKSLNFSSIEQIELVPYGLAEDGSPLPAPAAAEKEKALAKLREHQIDLVIDFSEKRYYLNDMSPKSQLAKRLFGDELQLQNSGASGTSPQAEVAAPSGYGFIEEKASGEPIRYVDWLVPGIIGMNIMFSCLFGVGYVIVRYRKNGVLKRLKATPVSAFTFVSAQAVSRLLIVLVTSVVVYAGTNLFLGFVMKGSYLLLLLVAALGSLCLIAIGLLFAARLKSEELANGLMNLLTFPMMLGSGVFFSLEGTPQILQIVSKAFPLTHFIDASRVIMLQGGGFMEILPNLVYLAGTTLAAFLISAKLFKWE